MTRSGVVVVAVVAGFLAGGIGGVAGTALAADHLTSLRGAPGDVGPAGPAGQPGLNGAAGRNGVDGDLSALTGGLLIGDQFGCPRGSSGLLLFGQERVLVSAQLVNGQLLTEDQVLCRIN